MLTVKDMMTRELERSWWRYPGAKDAAIRDLSSESSTRYYLRLNQLLECPHALAHTQTLARRLRRMRAARQGARGQHRTGFAV